MELEAVVDLEVEIEKTGPQGYSAYEVYMQNGGTLSEEEWLNSLKGENGKDGTDGKDGITPTIGEDGNWYLGDLDTGKPSRGEKGEKGDTGEPGKDGVSGVTIEEVENIAGSLENLNTEDKTNLVNAINEIFNNTGFPILDSQEIDICNPTINYGAYILMGRTTLKYGANSTSTYIINSNYRKTIMILGHGEVGQNGGVAYIFENPLSGGARVTCLNNQEKNSVVFGQALHKNENASIYGKYDFYHSLPTSSLVPTNDNQFTNKKYVDDAISALRAELTGGSE